MFRSVSTAALNAFEQIRLRFFTKAVEFGHFASIAGSFEFLDRIHAEFLVERLDFLRPQPGNFQHLDQTGWNRSFQLIVILQFAGCDEFGDFFRERFADTFDFAEPIFGDNFCQRLA